MSCKAQQAMPTGSKGKQACLSCDRMNRLGGSMSKSILRRLSFVCVSALIGSSTCSKVGHGLRE